MDRTVTGRGDHRTGHGQHRRLDRCQPVAAHSDPLGAANSASHASDPSMHIGGYALVCRRSADYARVRRALSHSERTVKGALTARPCSRKRSLTWHDGRFVAKN